MSANSTVETVPANGFDTPRKLSEGGQLSTVFEVSRSRHVTEKGLQDYRSINGISGSNHAPPAGEFRGGSPGSSVGQIYNEKLREQSPRGILYRESTARSQGRRPSTRGEAMPMQNGHCRTSMAESFKAQPPKKRKKTGLGTVIRKIFGRSVKNRISLPATTENHYNV